MLSMPRAQLRRIKQDLYRRYSMIQYGAKRKWDIDDVIYTFDQNLNMTLAELSSLSGWTVAELKEVLNG